MGTCECVYVCVYCTFNFFFSLVLRQNELCARAPALSEQVWSRCRAGFAGESLLMSLSLGFRSPLPRRRRRRHHR